MSIIEYTLIIPTLNAEKVLERIITEYRNQTLPPKHILVVDSSSEDETVKIAESYGADILVIKRSEFDHGKTRDLAIRKVDTPYVIFTTQDAIPYNDKSVEKLFQPFINGNNVALVGGRQIPYPDARIHEKLVRENNYSSENRVWGKEAVEKIGIRAFLISDVFAAYSCKAYFEVGGFDYPIMTNEDMLITQKFLDADYMVGYQGEAAVFHSHNLTWKEQYKRNFIVGRTMKRYEERFKNVSEVGEGTNLAKKVLCALMKKREYKECFLFCLDCSARLLGNRMGRFVESWRKT